MSMYGLTLEKVNNKLQNLTFNDLYAVTVGSLFFTATMVPYIKEIATCGAAVGAVIGASYSFNRALEADTNPIKAAFAGTFAGAMTGAAVAPVAISAAIGYGTYDGLSFMLNKLETIGLRDDHKFEITQSAIVNQYRSRNRISNREIDSLLEGNASFENLRPRRS